MREVKSEAELEFLKKYVKAFNKAYSGYLRKRKPTLLYEPIKDLLSRGGKRLRPALCMMSCELVGGDLERALPTAICLELFHNFSLVHDDIQDGSVLRRGQPTLHVKYGIPAALNAGDGLYSLAYKALLQNKERFSSMETAWRILEVFTEMSLKLVEGQAMDLEFKERKEMSEPQLIEHLKKKTGALFSASAECGALAGGAAFENARKLGRCWEAVGIAFQIRDDLLNLTGNEEKYGKRIGEDISEGKPTLMLVHCLGRCTEEDKKKIYAAMSEYDKKKIKAVIRIFEKYGSLEYAERRAREFLERGVRGIKRFKADGVNEEMRENMVQLARYFVEREL
ncbi:MAG: Geranylgeranyl pyrophosphate synthase [Candidatus Alkanophagales archaeon MCA70_species_2]|nr:Geranylgeranyl pyrophosphate synthase [Candidatus Alkanophaga liquidiphilum]